MLMAKISGAEFWEMCEEFEKLTPEEQYERCTGQKSKYEPEGESKKLKYEHVLKFPDYYDGAQGDSNLLKYEPGSGSGSSSEDRNHHRGTPKHLRPHLDLLYDRYCFQVNQSDGFDILDDFVKTTGGIVQYPGFSDELDLLLDLANRAINEYNDKHSTGFKYKVLKIEKVNHKLTGYRHYYMTVKVSNLTLVTPIHTFQIHAAVSRWPHEKFIFSCCLKEEAALVGELQMSEA